MDLSGFSIRRINISVQVLPYIPRSAFRTITLAAVFIAKFGPPCMTNKIIYSNQTNSGSSCSLRNKSVLSVLDHFSGQLKGIRLVYSFL